MERRRRGRKSLLPWQCCLLPGNWAGLKLPFGHIFSLTHSHTALCFPSFILFVWSTTWFTHLIFAFVVLGNIFVPSFGLFIVSLPLEGVCLHLGYRHRVCMRSAATRAAQTPVLAGMPRMRIYSCWNVMLLIPHTDYTHKTSRPAMFVNTHWQTRQCFSFSFPLFSPPFPPILSILSVQRSAFCDLGFLTWLSDVCVIVADREGDEVMLPTKHVFGSCLWCVFFSLND